MPSFARYAVGVRARNAQYVSYAHQAWRRRGRLGGVRARLQGKKASDVSSHALPPFPMGITPAWRGDDTSPQALVTAIALWCSRSFHRKVTVVTGLRRRHGVGIVPARRPFARQLLTYLPETFSFYPIAVGNILLNCCRASLSGDVDAPPPWWQRWLCMLLVVVISPVVQSTDISGTWAASPVMTATRFLPLSGLPPRAPCRWDDPTLPPPECFILPGAPCPHALQVVDRA